ncbi:MAG TPA: hypothetical protein DDW52_23850 [Planctomycetaceae bacterium]|nr:hypothetical protein [Planctomycetaceae bacterium]
MNINWPTSLPDYFDEEKLEAFHPYMIHVFGDENTDRAIEFVTAHVRHLSNACPPGTSHWIQFDFTKQCVTTKKMLRMREEITAALAPLDVTVNFYE